MVILCATTTLILRTGPNLLTELVTRRPLKAVPIRQIFVSILIEILLLTVGALGSWVFPDTVVEPIIGVLAIGLVIVEMLHLRKYALLASEATTH